ncbi:hypothetical protein KF840_26625 [bacterium]|nr:hypothetical protein [bacterium]
MTLRRALAQGLILLGSWLLVQVPAKDEHLDDPGSNLPPIASFTVVKQFDSAGDCEAYRDFTLQDGAYAGSDAMMDQASQLRCVAATSLTPGADPTPSAATPKP